MKIYIDQKLSIKKYFKYFFTIYNFKEAKY